MASSDWVILGGLGLAAILLLRPGDSQDAQSGDAAGSGSYPGSFPFVGGTGQTPPGYGDGGPPPLFQPEPSPIYQRGTPQREPNYLDRVKEGFTDPGGLGATAQFLIGGAALGAGAAGYRYFARRGKLGSRGATEVPESFRPSPTPEASRVKAPTKPATSPRRPVAVDLPKTPATKPKPGRFRFGPGLVVEGIAETGVLNTLLVATGRPPLNAPAPKGKQRPQTNVRYDPIAATQERVY